MCLDLSISLINHSNPDLLRDCLRSLYASTHTLRLDIWIVDNATDKRLVAEMQAEFPHVRWLFNAERLGFSANHNQVLKQASGRYLCILNDDTLIHDETFDTLVAYMDAHPPVGMAGAKLLNKDGSLQNCTFRFPSLLSELWGICFLPASLAGLKTGGIDAAQTRNKPAQVDWVLGACIVTRSETVQQIGLLDSELSPIANTEEVDWCRRAHQSGWQVVYCPDAVITHYGGQSLNKAVQAGADPIRVEMYRTRLAFFRKHYGVGTAALLRLIYALSLPWNLLMLTQSILRRRISSAEGKRHAATLARIAIVSAFTRARFVRW